MKRNIWKIAAAAAVLSFIILTFMGAGRNQDEKQVIDLLEKRTIIMEDMLSRSITFDEGKSLLKEVEKGSLYRKDIQAIKDRQNTDYEKTIGMNVVSIENTGSIYDRRKYVCRIQWIMENYQGMDKYTYTYDVGVEWDGQSSRLITFEIQ